MGITAFDTLQHLEIGDTRGLSESDIGSAGDVILSVVIPCLNRHEMVQDCIKSILALGNQESVQIVLVDDGSSPPLAASVESLLRENDILLVQSNQGRASALRNGILAAQGSFTMIMDSDDEMIPGAMDSILEDVSMLGDDLLGIVYEAADFNTGASIGSLPPIEAATLLELRADYGVVGDLKEVVRSDALRSTLYSDPSPERRVPTSFLWAGVSSIGRVRVARRAVVRHRYLADGMTKTIRDLKKRNPGWLSKTYYRIASAPRSSYRSTWFRFSYALKAEAVWPGGLPSNHRREIRRILGSRLGVLAYLGGFVLRMLR